MSTRGESEPLLRNNERATVEEQDEQVKFPWRQLIVLAFCRLAEPIAFMSIIAYSFEMVKAIRGPENASFYSGLLVSAFALAEACTAMAWGSLSDRYGRKPIILVALAGTALSSLLFGVAKNYWFALLARVVGGLLNGNVAVMQTMVAEMVAMPEHEPRAYAMQPFVWSLGSIAGSALGGFTAEPAESYPRFFSRDGLFGKFPYLLPNLVSVTIIVAAMIVGFFLLEETNPKFATPANTAAKDPDEEAVDDGASLSQQHTNTSQTPFKIRRASDASFMVSSAPTPIDPSFDLRRPSFTSIDDFRIQTKLNLSHRVETIDESNSVGSSQASNKVKAFNREVVLWVVALVLMSYHQMAFGSNLPIYLLDQPRQPPKHLDLEGGQGSTLPEVGTYLAINSAISIFIQGLIFPIYVSKLGVWRAVTSATYFVPLVQLLIPLVSLLPKPSVGIYIAMTLQNFATIIIYPSVLIMLKNATPSPLVLGKVNGLAMSACSGARTVAPPVVGLVYSTLGSAAAWWSCAVISIIAALEFLVIQRPKDKNETIMRRASVSVPVAD